MKNYSIYCHCGGVMGKHVIGEGDCYRERVENIPKPIGNKWLVEGQLITEFTLLEQRMYAYHGNNVWSRPKDHSSTNTLPDET